MCNREDKFPGYMLIPIAWRKAQTYGPVGTYLFHRPVDFLSWCLSSLLVAPQASTNTEKSPTPTEQCLGQCKMGLVCSSRAHNAFVPFGKVFLKYLPMQVKQVTSLPGEWRLHLCWCFVLCTLLLPSSAVRRRFHSHRMAEFARDLWVHLSHPCSSWDIQSGMPRPTSRQLWKISKEETPFKRSPKRRPPLPLCGINLQW